MTTLFRKLFHLFPGEERGAGIFSLLAFFWAAAVTSGLKFADALFLLHVGAESLPLLYSLSAGCMILIASLLIYSFHTFPPYRVFMAALFIAALFYLTVFFTFSYAEKESWIWYVLRIFGSVNFAIIGTSFWTFIDQYYHLQDAKRLFSLFNSMMFLGISTTGFIMLLGLIEFQTLSLLIASFLFISIALIYYIHKTERPVHDDTDLEVEPLSYKKFFLGIFRSKFTLLLMTSNLLIYLLMATTEFNYYNTFDRLFDPGGLVAVGDEADASLTLFLGKALAGVSVANVIFGLFFYSRLLRRFGIGWLLPITPLLLLTTYTSWQFSDALWIALLGYFVVEGTTYVIDDSNFTLLLNAVPIQFKHKIRIAIESFFEPIGTLIAAALLSTSFIDPKLLGLCLSAALLTIAIILQRNYLQAIWQNLAENALRFGRSTAMWFQGFSKIEKKLFENRLLALIRMKEATPFAMQCLIEAEDRTGIQKLVKTAANFLIEDKVALIKNLQNSEFSSDVIAVELAQNWLMEAEDPRLVEELYWYLAQQGLLHPHKLNDELESDNLKLKGAAILTLLTANADISTHEAWENKTLAYEKIRELFDSDDTASIEIGLKIVASDASALGLDIVLTYITHPSPLIQREAARVVYLMASPKSTKLAPRIAALLTETRETVAREFLLKALGKIGDARQVEAIVSAQAYFRPSERRIAEEALISMGLRNIPLLISLVKDTALPDRARLAAGKALGKIALFQLRAHLEAILKPEINRALTLAAQMRKVEKDADLDILADTLRSDYFSVLDFIIQLLGVAGEVDDTELLSRALRNGYVKIQSQAIETIEKTCEPRIFRMLRPLFERSGQQISTQTIDEILESMRFSSSIGDKIVAYTMLKKRGKEGWEAALKKEMTTSSDLFKHFAYELLES